MALAAEDIDYIKEHIPQWLADISLAKPPVVYEIELRERAIRVEEELKHQRELMLQGFAAMERRFEAVDKRIEDQRELMQQGFAAMERRFEAVDKRFEAVDKRFESMQQQMDKRFEAVDKRFESMQQQMDKRFEAVDKRFDAMTRRIDRFMIWSFSTTVAVGGIIIGALKFWPT